MKIREEVLVPLRRLTVATASVRYLRGQIEPEMEDQKNPTPSPLRVALVGYGTMGHEIERLAAERGAQISATFDLARPIAANAPIHADVAIEFTHPNAVLGNIKTLVELGCPVVVGTTGWDRHVDEVRQLVAAAQGRVLYGSNFSVGVNLFFRIVRAAAQLLNGFPMYDAALFEAHHNRKADAPSGTAVTLASILLEQLDRKTELCAGNPTGRIDPAALHVSSQRVGAVVGTHTVTFDAEADTIELTHRARNRSGFALGALLAAEWLVGQPPGFYRFEEIF